MIIAIIVILIFLSEIIDVSIIADVTVYLGKKQNKTKTKEQKKKQTKLERKHTHTCIYTNLEF